MHSFVARTALVIAAAVLLVGHSSAKVALFAAPGPCTNAGDTVTVVAHKRELWLCHEGSARGPFPVALGRGGVDKHREGDARTPLGIYPLGAPRPSDEYGLFIPIGYPTPEQAAEGYTGGAIGIHGPPRGKFQSAQWTTSIDWTLGCIATGDDVDLSLIADFVRARQPAIVVVR